VSQKSPPPPFLLIYSIDNQLEESYASKTLKTRTQHQSSLSLSMLTNNHQNNQHYVSLLDMREPNARRHEGKSTLPPFNTFFQKQTSVVNSPGGSKIADSKMMLPSTSNNPRLAMSLVICTINRKEISNFSSRAQTYVTICALLNLNRQRLSLATKFNMQREDRPMMPALPKPAQPMDSTLSDGAQSQF
jgi:hypothetical protein